MLLEAVGDVFEEDKTKDDVLVFRCVHVAAQFFRSEPELLLKANVSGVVVR